MADAPPGEGAPARWLVVGDEGGLAAAVCRELESRGDPCVRLDLDWGDGAPTQGMREVRAALTADHRSIRDDLAALRSTEVAELERLAREAELPRLLLAP